MTLKLFLCELMLKWGLFLRRLTVLHIRIEIIHWYTFEWNRLRIVVLVSETYAL